MKTNCQKCGSSDANHVYEDGHRYCFSCNTRSQGELNERQPDRDTMDFSEYTNMGTIPSYGSYAINSRGISKEVVDYFNVKMSLTAEGKPESHFYPYTKGGEIVAYKERRLPKDFRVHGTFKDVELFGQDRCTGNRMLVICEGELDALSVAQAWQETRGRIFPVVSLPSASATSSALAQRDWLNRFDTIILMLDNDEAGQKATDYLGKMLKPGKVRVAPLNRKDPSEVLIKDGAKALAQLVYDATPWSPSGIVMGEAVWEQFKNRQNVESIPYPDCLDGLNHKLRGIRHGEITLFTSGTGSGKSTVIKEIILDLLAKTEDKVGLISLEESVGDTAEKFISMQLKRGLNDPPPLAEEEVRSGFDAVFGDERLVLLDHQGSVGDDSLIDKIEYMALLGCKYLVLDHITIAVSEGSEGLSGNEAIDKIMSRPLEGS